MKTRRVEAIDVVRGLIMALMALDHTRMFFSAAQFDPVSIGDTSLGYFLTRWITHLCAPGFFFLAGLSVFLAETRGQPARTSSALLIARGLWLIALELTVIGLAWSFTMGWYWFGVIWSLGTCMILLAGLRWIPPPFTMAAAAIFILLHNVVPIATALPAGVSDLLYSSGALAGRWVLFPVLPWLAIMVLGFAIGPWLAPGGEVRMPRFALLGAGLTAAFVVARLTGFGEPTSGGVQHGLSQTEAFMSFMNVEKYPPSTQFTLVTLGLLLLLVAVVARIGADYRPLRWVITPLQVFGRVPFFFYVLHLFAIHGLAWLSAAVLEWPRDWLFWRGEPNLIPPDGYGVSLSGVYLVWLIVLLMLLPICIRFARIKARSTSLWTKFL